MATRTELSALSFLSIHLFTFWILIRVYPYPPPPLGLEIIDLELTFRLGL
jgi:hypothetical protein